MGVRGAGHRFLPNRLVFPGGAVDASDRTAPAATEPSPALMAALQRVARPPLARAIAMAAARELEEEAGVSLGAPPRLDRLAYLCRAVTPTHLPIRFNARFLTVDADALDGVPRDSHELQQVRFYPIDEAICLDLMEVTCWVLQTLQKHRAQPVHDGINLEPLVFGPKRRRHDGPRSPTRRTVQE